MNTLPKDPVMLLSFVNTKLRDEFPNLTELAKTFSIESDEIIDKLKLIDYEYNSERNQFV